MLAGVTIACALAACSHGSSDNGGYGTGDPSLAAPDLGGGPINPFLSNGQAVLRALDVIASHSGRPMRVTTISADQEAGLNVDVQQPKNHINVDHYVIAKDGTLSGPVPVKLMSLDGGPITAAKIDAQVFDPKAFAFARLAQTEREAIAQSKYPDARVANWEFDGIGPDDRRFIYMQSARARPTAAVTPQLKIVRMTF